MRGGGQKGGKKTVAMLLLFGCLILGGIVLAVCVGKYPVTPAESLRIIWDSLFGLPSAFPVMKRNVVLGLRIPRILASVMVGAALSMSGTAYQGAFKNPLISPDLLGVLNGACIGAAIAILLSLSTFYISMLAFLGGICSVLLTMSIPTLVRNHSNVMLVLSGVIVGSFMSSCLGFIKFVADPEMQLASIVYWTMGSFSYVTMGELLVILPLLVVPAVVLILIAWWIDVLSMGEDEARALGANIRLIRTVTIACATLLTAGSVCIAGSIGWIALIVPHFGRLLVGPSNRRLMPLSALIGGAFMLAVDTLTRVIGVVEMPVSILTGAIGAPFYIWLLASKGRCCCDLSIK